MRIDAFLSESPMFAVNRAARHFESLAVRALAADKLGFLEGLVLAALFFEAPRQVKPSELAATFATTRGNISHCVSALEAKGLLQRKIDPGDARAYLLTLKAGQTLRAARHRRVGPDAKKIRDRNRQTRAERCLADALQA